MRPAPRIPALYAFRKPFSAATFALVPGWTFALDYKIALVIAQVVGYALSKLIGIKAISELDPAKRASAIIVLNLLPWAALVLFALIPVPWNVAAMFLNGLPLGMIWGLVFGFMEGRRTSEVLGAVVCASFIVSSGAVKSVGKLLMANWQSARSGCPPPLGRCSCHCYCSRSSLSTASESACWSPPTSLPQHAGPDDDSRHSTPCCSTG
jgi:hypothetical protein